MSELKYIFGPVPSRRLGLSLGVNIIPSKICSMDCVYCEIGRSKFVTLQRRPYIKSEDILYEFSQEYLRIGKGIDVITVTGAGEPTLNTELDKVVSGIKKITDKPIAILTNSSLISNQDVYESLLKFDIVVPSLDSVINSSLQKVDRPHQDIDINKIIEGLKRFSVEYNGQLYLEILLCKGLNDTDEDMFALGNILKKVATTKVHLGTITRPPAYSDIEQVDDEVLLKFVKYFKSLGINSELVAGFDKVFKDYSPNTNISNNILALIKMRPSTLEDIVAVFNILEDEARNLIDMLISKNLIKSISYNHKNYYCHILLDEHKINS